MPPGVCTPYSIASHCEEYLPPPPPGANRTYLTAFTLSHQFSRPFLATMLLACFAARTFYLYVSDFASELMMSVTTNRLRHFFVLGLTYA